MNIHFAKFNPTKIGGGWTAQYNLASGLGHCEYDEADIYFIAGGSMVERSEVMQAKADGKKIVLRLDNAPRNSRNRNTGMSRIKDFCAIADLVIYQSEWAKRFLYPFTKRDGAVILNGVDTALYNKNNRIDRDKTYLYARSSRDEGKQWIMAWYWFVNKKGTLEIAGRFSPENREYNFDFFNNEKYVFVGEQPNLVECYKRNKYFLYTYLNDACSNTLIESLLSGCEVINVYNTLTTGGAPEIMEAWRSNWKILTKEYMCQRYLEEMKKIV